MSTGLKTEEASLYLAAEQLINHLTAPHDQGGLGVDPGSIVLVGQSIGSAVASEMCLRCAPVSPPSRHSFFQLDGWHILGCRKIAQKVGDATS